MTSDQVDPECPFCHHDPYEYVDIGVGYERVAVTCCGAGIALIQYREPLAIRALNLIQSDDPRRQRHGQRIAARMMG